MSLLENFTKKVTETAKAAAKKSSDLVEVTKLNMSISTEEEKIQKAYVEMGKTVYEAYNKSEEVGDTFREQCEKIKSYEENIKEIKQKILELKNVKLCPGCGAELDNEVAFCSKCGAKQEIPNPVEEVREVTEKLCSSCNTSNSLEASFCCKCGSKLE